MSQVTETGEVLIKIDVDPSKGEAGANHFADTVDKGMEKVVDSTEKATSAAKRQIEIIVKLERAHRDNAQSAARAAAEQQRANDQVRRSVEQTAALERKLLNDIDKATKTSVQARIAEYRREAQGHSDAIERMKLDRTKAMQLHALNQDSLSATIQRALKDEEEAHRKTVKSITEQYLRLAGTISVAIGGAAAIGVPTVRGFQKNAAMEDMGLSIAGLVSANETVKDATGRQIEGSEKILAVQAQVREVMAQIQEDALLSKATTEELVRAFQSAVGPAMAVGFSLEQVEKYAVAGSRAVAALGIPLQQVDQELRSIVDGTIDINSRLAKALQITNEEVALHRAKGDLFEHLMRRFQDLNTAGEMAGKTFSGLWSSMTDVVDLFLRLSTQDLFAEMKGDLDDLLGQMISVDEHGVLKINSDLQIMADRISEILSDTAELVKSFGKLGSWTMGPGLENLWQMYRDIKGILTMTVGYPAAALGAGLAMPMGPSGSSNDPAFRAASEEYRRRYPGGAWGIAREQTKDDMLSWTPDRYKPAKTASESAAVSGSYTFHSLARETNLDAARREIERVKDVHESLGTTEGLKRALSELETWQKNHQLGSEAAQKLTAETNRLRHQIEQRTKSEERAAESARKRAEREEEQQHKAWLRERSLISQYSEPAGPVDTRDWANQATIGDVSFLKPWMFRPKTPLGHMGLADSIKEKLSDRKHPLETFSASAGTDPLPGPELRSVVADLLPEDETAEMLRRGLEMGVKAAEGDWSGFADEAGKMIEDAVIRALVGETTQQAMAQLSAALAGPTGIAIAFGLILFNSVTKAANKAKEEAGSFRDHLAGIWAKNREDSVQRDIERDPKVKALREQLARDEAELTARNLARGSKQASLLDTWKDNSLTQAINDNAGRLKELTRAYQRAEDLKKGQEIVDQAWQLRYQNAGLADDLAVARGTMSSTDAQFNRLDRDEEQKRNEIWSKYGHMAEVRTLIDRMEVGFKLMRDILHAQLEAQREQLNLARADRIKHLGNRLDFLKGQITEEEFNKREGRLNIVEQTRREIAQQFNLTPTQAKAIPDSIEGLRQWLTQRMGGDNDILREMNQKLEILALETQRGTSAANPIYVRDVDRMQPYPLDPAIYFRQLSRAAGTPMLSLYNGGQAQGGASSGPIVVQMGGVTIDARGAQNPHELQAATANGLVKGMASNLKLQKQLQALNNNASRNNTGLVNTV